MSDIRQEIPVIQARLQDDPIECRRASEALAKVGCFAFEGTSVDAISPKVTAMFERYYRQSDEIKARDVRRDIFFQVGLTPAFEETAFLRPEILATLRPDQPITPHNGTDPKERFMAPVGERPLIEGFEQMTMPPVVPEGFPEWQSQVDAWGKHAIEVMMTVARMAAIGFGLEREAFAELLVGGSHLFAPTGSDLSKYGKPGTVLAAAHTDLNFMSVHGKANTPGLYVWTRDGRRVAVRVPEGCLLVQAGQQFQRLTGGEVLAGVHEVISVPGMQAYIDACTAAGLVPWRASTTLFGHVRADHVLRPLGHFATADRLARYPEIKAGQQVKEELELIFANAGAK